MQIPRTNLRAGCCSLAKALYHRVQCITEGALVLPISNWGISPAFDETFHPVLLPNDPPKMDEERNDVTIRILNFTMEIIYLLTGENYTMVKKTSTDGATPNRHLDKLGRLSRGQSPITEAPPHLPIHEQKILELTNKIIELLTGEVPIRCQDVTVHFSMEEWEYLEGHQDLYKDIMMENYQPPISQDNPSENSDGNSMSLLNYKVKEEDIMPHFLGENLINFHVHPELDSTDLSYDPNRNSDGNVMSSVNYKEEVEDIVQRSLGENPITLNVHPELDSTE
ncbi:uncharacterized protein, partial [Eleutherodactylus coqui]|uniref:uncharacterized protein n=1 Tax=Eleutherodactylus coqui TaxID=57060 RepID=UPI003461DC83